VLQLHGRSGAGPTVPLGQPFLRLDSSWKFHTGDNPRWADPSFDDGPGDHGSVGAARRDQVGFR